MKSLSTFCQSINVQILTLKSPQLHVCSCEVLLSVAQCHLLSPHHCQCIFKLKNTPGGLNALNCPILLSGPFIIDLSEFEIITPATFFIINHYSPKITKPKIFTKETDFTSLSRFLFFPHRNQLCQPSNVPLYSIQKPTQPAY